MCGDREEKSRCSPVSYLSSLSPSPQAEAHTVQDAVSAIRRLATGLWPASRTILFGSQATGLALPGSDLDIVILGASDELENPASGFSWDQRHALGDRLRALLKAMRKANLVAGKAVVIKARVPIIKCDLRSGVAVDVSLGAANGAAAVRFIHKQVSGVENCESACGGRTCPFPAHSHPRKWVYRAQATALWERTARAGPE